MLLKKSATLIALTLPIYHVFLPLISVLFQPVVQCLSESSCTKKKEAEQTSPPVFSLIYHLQAYFRVTKSAKQHLDSLSPKKKVTENLQFLNALRAKCAIRSLFESSI